VSDKDDEIKLLADKVYAVNNNNISEVLKELKPNAIVRKKRFFSKKETNDNNFSNTKTNNSDDKHSHELKNDNKEEILKLTTPFKLIIKEELEDGEIKKLKEILGAHNGDSEVYIFEHFSDKIIKTPFKVNTSIILISEIKKEFPQKIRVVES
jgi:hypothetical protein